LAHSVIIVRKFLISIVWKSL